MKTFIFKLIEALKKGKNVCISTNIISIKNVQIKRIGQTKNTIIIITDKLEFIIFKNSTKQIQTHKNGFRYSYNNIYTSIDIDIF